MENNEIMYEEVNTETNPVIVETEKKDLSGLICFGLGVAATFAGKFAVKGVKKLANKIKNKKASKESENEDIEDETSEDEE